VVTLGRIELLSLHNLNVRLAVYMLRMARLRGRAEPAGAIWVGAVESQSEVGARVGGTRQRVNRALTTWAKKGIVELHKNGVRILDLKRLTAEAEKSGFDVAGYLSGWHGGWQGRA
jgi:CRP-like cAMP-binding protein